MTLEVREGESLGSPGYGLRRVWVLTSTPSEAERGPAHAVERSKIASANHIHADSTPCIPECEATPGVEDRTAALLC